MTKQALQKELLEKVKPGTKPSDIRKLKRSKSADDLPNPSPSRLSELETENTELKKELELASQTVSELTKLAQKSSLFQEQLKEKQKEVENLRGKLETKSSELSQTQRELDNSLLARHQALKQFGIVHEKLKQVKKELDENVEQGSEELINQDETISKLRNQKQQAKLKVQQLERDLNLSSRLAELRKVPLPDDFSEN